PDERDAGVGAGLGEVGVLREEAVSGVHGVGARLPRRPDHLLHVEVGAHRMPTLADEVGLVGLGPVQRVAGLVREAGHRPPAEGRYLRDRGRPYRRSGPPPWVLALVLLPVAAVAAGVFATAAAVLALLGVMSWVVVPLVPVVLLGGTSFAIARRSQRRRALRR